ncbi:hypothetical protein CC86DRAFT_403093 [Ophiobolus disseminans]|uniref:Uncharacterized protein n=1 Tax=Ophiobolus disseminans TaxID=1469910 RepID=A0A6A7A902_9PLEO|nr:hypothetical protein CC86DRAFT_403093 [Ophiobolus disseminans]
MKPQKRSIKDFFSPVSRTPQDTARPPPQLQDAGNARASPSSVSSTPQNPTPLTINTPTAPARPSISPAPHAPTAAKPASADPQPPPASQTSANSGASRRIVSNGEQVVLNSDSDTDSLPDLDWGLPTTSSKTKTVAPPPTTRSKRTTEYDNDGLRKPEKKPRSKKRTFDRVFETAQKHKELERVITEHKAHLNNHEEAAAEFVFSEDALGQAVQNDDDPEQAHRLYLAMQRTSATQEKNVYHFFRDTSDSIAVQSRFPAHSLPDHRWTASFRDASARDQAFMTGFARQVFRLQELPEEIASWMIDQICLDPSGALDEKYAEILEAHNEYLQKLLDRNRLDAIFRTLGGDVKSLGAGVELSLDAPSARLPSLPPSLKSTLRLLGSAAPWLKTKARNHALYILWHVCMDDRVLADPDVLETLQDAIEATICNFADNHKLVQGVGSPSSMDQSQSLIASQLSDVLPRLLLRVIHPVMQRNLVCALLANSPLTAYLQRHLALAFVLHPMTVEVSLADPQLPRILHKHLETSPNFHINKKTDYGSLAARMTLLDIAIGPGLLTVPYQPLVSPSTSQSGSSPIMAPVPVLSELKDFNKEIDALALHIKILGNSIVEAGAVVDLTILEAKDCVERLCSRLEHAVQIGGKKSHNVFSSDDEVKQLKVTDIFRKVAARAGKTGPTGGIFDDEDDAGTDEAVAAQLESEAAR